MTRKKQQSVVGLPGQLALNFDVFAVATPDGVVAAVGANPLDAKIRSALAALMDRAAEKGLSRDRLADHLCDELGRSVTKAQLDQWAAPSQADRRIPVDVWIALMSVCDDVAPLEGMAMHLNRRVLTVDEALCAELGAMSVLDRHIKAKSRAIEGQMDEKLLGQLLHRIKRNAK